MGGGVQNICTFWKIFRHFMYFGPNLVNFEEDYRFNGNYTQNWGSYGIMPQH